MVDLRDGIALGKTPQEGAHDEMMKALQAIAMQCYETTEAVKNFSNMIYDMLDAQGVIAEVNAKRLHDAREAEARAAQAETKPKKKKKGKK